MSTVVGQSWRLGREDTAAVFAILLLPLVLAAPALGGFLLADPLIVTGGLTEGMARGFLPGAPDLDPNSGYGTQALGRLAALEWLRGNVPWWNYYTGVGLPLAAEYQPAAFFPLTLLLLLPNGMLLQSLMLQWLAGLGTYGLLRHMGLARVAALAGALVFAFNGTYSWFSHAPVQPVAFLPWILWGIERAWRAAATREPGGWRMLALAMAMSLLAGFPETAYLDGLLALAWTLVRGLQLPAPGRWAYVLRIVPGGLAGVAIAAPQIYAFAEYLPHADIGIHGSQFATAAMGTFALVPSVIAPHVFGPPMAYFENHMWLFYLWGAIGGYVTLALVVAAAYGACARRGALAWLLVAWVVLTLARTVGVPGTPALWNLIPGVSVVAFYRYAPPSWELALVIMAAWGVDAVARDERVRRGALAAAFAVLCVGIGAAIHFTAPHWYEWWAVVPLRNWMAGSIAWALATSLALLAFAAARRPGAMAVVLAFDAMLMFAIPTLTNPRAGTVNTAATGFLRDNLGLQRFFTLGPIQPNYGAYFGIASINYNYLPNSRAWVGWVRAHLDRGADSVVFNGGARSPGAPPPAEELRRNLAAFEEVGVKYVVALAGTRPLEGVPGVREVHASGTIRILELPAPRPYFELAGGRCNVIATDRERVIADCAEPDVLVRRELFHPGWTASASGKELPIVEHGGLFQAVALPAGRSELRFTYAPPHVEWAWLAALAGLLVLPLPTLRRALR